MTTLNNLTAKVEKGALQSMIMGEPKVNDVLDRTSWTITLSEGAENSGDNLIDGNYWTDVARSGQGFTITIDLGSIKTITGVNTTSWSWTSNHYAPQEVEVAVFARQCNLEIVRHNSNKWRLSKHHTFKQS